MKKLICIISFIFLLAIPASAITWITADQITVAWDPITTVSTPDILKYGVYMKKLPNGEPVLIGEQDPTTATLTFTEEGRYIIGISTVRYIDKDTADEIKLESAINWSDINGDSTPNPFGSSYYITPEMPTNFRKQ